MQETIRYAWGTSSLGEFLCAASACGLVSLEFGKRESSLASLLPRRFPGAALIEDPATLQEAVEQAASLIEHPAQNARLPVDPRGSDFERQVWCALQEIPPEEPRATASWPRGSVCRGLLRTSVRPAHPTASLS